ncbi:MAG: type II toxin-antitoxin system VapC family toxin [Planctomycetaceae bacterium]|jgi:predicted nucleic acid-binding protein|nr:type II toxin-antitoxin system VapC family toxin [Planctomycetaceae bacterium]
MENKMVIDSCIFIDYFRTRNKTGCLLKRLLRNNPKVFVSAIAKYEVLCGSKYADLLFWQETFKMFLVLPVDDTTIEMAHQIHRQLKRDRCLLDIADILIAATAIVNDLPLATINRKHFERINGLRLVDLSDIHPKPQF